MDPGNRTQERENSSWVWLRLTGGENAPGRARLRVGRGSVRAVVGTGVPPVFSVSSDTGGTPVATPSARTELLPKSLALLTDTGWKPKGKICDPFAKNWEVAS
jgi:hypothetical protein